MMKDWNERKDDSIFEEPHQSKNTEKNIIK